MTSPAPAAANPWISVWNRPSATILPMLQRPASPWVLMLGSVGGVIQVLWLAQQTRKGAQHSVFDILAVAILAGTFWGLVQLAVFAAALLLVGRLLNSRGSFDELCTVIALTAAPQIAACTFWLGGAMIWGRLLFIDHGDPPVQGDLSLAAGLLIIRSVGAVCSFWQAVILVPALATAQDGSIWRAIASILLSIAIPLGALKLIFAIINAIAG